MIRFNGTVNGISNTSFGIQNIPSIGSFGCSVIQQMTVGDTITLSFNDNIDWSFASLTIIKL
jgi:hypothetical protein